MDCCTADLHWLRTSLGPATNQGRRPQTDPALVLPEVRLEGQPPFRAWLWGRLFTKRIAYVTVGVASADGGLSLLCPALDAEHASSWRAGLAPAPRDT